MEPAPAARLVPPGVQARGEPRVGGQVLIQRLLGHDGAAGHVDQDGVRLHQGQFSRADQPAGAGGQRQRDDQHVRRGQHLVQVGQRAGPVHRLGGPAGAVHRVDTRAERAHQPRGGLADPAEAEDGAHRPVQRAGLGRPVELAAGQRRVLDLQALGQAERHRHDMLGDRRGVRADVAGHGDAGRDGGEVNAVQPGRQQLDEAQLGRAVQAAGRQLAAELPADQRAGLAQHFVLLFLAEPAEEADRGAVAEHVGVDGGEFAVNRVAHGYQPFRGHRASFRGGVDAL